MDASCCSKLLEYCEDVVMFYGPSGKPTTRSPGMYVVNPDFNVHEIERGFNFYKHWDKEQGFIHLSEDATVGQMRTISRQKFGKEKKSLVVVEHY